MNGTGSGVRDRLRQALRTAMRERDAAAVAALRSALAALDNAGAVPPPPAAPPAATAGPGEAGAEATAASHARVAGTVAGLGAAEVPRRLLTAPEQVAIVRAEVTEREAAAAACERAGRTDRADRLRAEAAALAAHLP